MDWQDLDVGGNLIIDKVCEAIDECEVFLCDLTDANPNVLFELGYALINNKRLWISIDESFFDSPKFYKDLKLLTTLGYQTHTSAAELYNKLLQDNPWNTLTNNPYSKVLKTHNWSYIRKPRLFYLKSSVNTNESRHLTREIEKNSIEFIADDPIEHVTTSSLEWYMEQIFTSYVVIAHFLDDVRDQKYPQNSKYALICGMAYGKGRKTVMVAHDPYIPEIDYRDMMHLPKSMTQFRKFVDHWIPEIAINLSEYRQKYQTRQFGESEKLGFLDIGEFKAEYEKNKLEDYFIRTPFLQLAMDTQRYHVFVGRKGSGKTASFYQIKNVLENEYRQSNYVCTIKPVDVELDAVFRLFQLSTPNDFKEHIIDNLWKFLIYSELIRDFYIQFDSKSKAQLNNEEEQLINFVNANRFILEDFSKRLETLLTEICDIDFDDKDVDGREKISQILHSQLFPNIRRLLGVILEPYDKLFILIDNLDKTWESANNVNLIAKFIFRLFKCAEQITEDFARSSSKYLSIDSAIVIFLRSDIYSWVIPHAKEPDKLNDTIIQWSDQELLLRVVEKRFVHSAQNIEHPEEVWGELFGSTVDEIATRDYLVSTVMPKPRDIIYICKYALMYAKNRGADKIEAIDIEKAEFDYSKHVWDTILVELRADIPEIEDILTEFAGEQSILTIDEIKVIISRYGGKFYDPELVLGKLLASNFLGIETEENSFTYLYDVDLQREKILQKLAHKTAKKVGIRRFQINRPFHRILEINRIT